ncbi:MAG: RdgB/HAM1 family non-canonical purine NTP pyrophosphatase [bacterium]|nr:RdgB/HAM1 family non-canonical purine NTP pyrophosphatase [bacterium]
MKLFFASHNLDKKREIEYIVSSEKLTVLYIDDFPKYPEVEETGSTLEENAVIKAVEGFNFTGLETFAEDTGLFVEAIGGEPGIYAARYAGENATYSDNCVKLLEKLEKVPSEKRRAYFKTVVAFKTRESIKFFTGICEGYISDKPAGSSGFGYDPIFIPDGYNKTFAELNKEVKNEISHRARAVKEFSDFLKKSIGA